MAKRQGKTSMRTAREILRLHFEGRLADRAIARSCMKSATTVGEIIKKFKSAGLEWPIDMGDEELEDILFPKPASTEGPHQPDWHALLLELKRHKSVTRMLLWKEYIERHPNGYKYSQFCHHLSEAARSVDPVMRQDYKAGEKLFIDWAGVKLPYIENGIAREASMFVAALGASNYTFVQVYPDEAQASWNLGHVECFEFLGGVPELIVPDNTKTGVTSPCYYDPDINSSYHELALHYGTAVVPARVRRPQDKAKVETAVQIAEREITAPLRNVTFHSLSELRTAVREKLDALNGRKFSKLNGSRNSLFDDLDKPVLRPLPSRRYSMGSWVKCTVFKDYHIQVEKHYYSVPWKYIGDVVEARIGASVVEVYRKGTRIACHKRSNEPGRSTTLEEHRPRKHNAMLQRSSQYYLEKAEKVGGNCVKTIAHTLDWYPHPEMAFRSCEGIFRLGRDYGTERLEKACYIAVKAETGGYKFILNVLRNNRDQFELIPTSTPTPTHANLRGKTYYQGGASC